MTGARLHSLAAARGGERISSDASTDACSFRTSCTCRCRKPCAACRLQGFPAYYSGFADCSCEYDPTPSTRPRYAAAGSTPRSRPGPTTGLRGGQVRHLLYDQSLLPFGPPVVLREIERDSPLCARGGRAGKGLI